MSLFKRIKNKIYFIRVSHMDPHKRAEYMRKKVYHMGENVNIYTTTLGTEPYLISIGDNVNVASGVHFITHDVSVFNVSRYLGGKLLDKVGPIILNNNCFIGAYAILMPGVTIGKNSIVAAGSVVTKNVPDNQVWGGAPAHFIMQLDEYAKKLEINTSDYPWVSGNEIIMNGERLVNERQKYFFNNKCR